MIMGKSLRDRAGGLKPRAAVRLGLSALIPFAALGCAQNNSDFRELSVRRECVKSHITIALVPMPNGNRGVRLQPMPRPVCDEDALICHDGTEDKCGDVRWESRNG